jgi:glycosyltransferase involved in cell wall biosynthesis
MPDAPDNAGPPLRILHLNSLLTGGGTDDQCVKLTQALQQLGQKVWVAGPEGRYFSKAIHDLGVPFHATPPEGPVKVYFIRSAAKFIREQKIQIVHGHHGRDIWPTIMAVKMSGTKPKIVLTRHMAKSPSSWFSRNFLLGKCDALIAVSKFTERVLREGVYEPDSPEAERHARPPLKGDYSKIEVIYGGIDTARFRPFEATGRRAELGLKPGDYAFAVVGGYDLPRGKGQREFLKAAARIHERVPAARFLIIGRGNMTDILRADIEQLGLAGKASLTPHFDDMPVIMNAIDCLVHPQVGTEALGLVVCEAHACGKPVIASALDGIPEAFAAGGYGQLVKPESLEELAAAMADWADRGALSAAEREALHEKVEAKFSVLAFGERMLNFYRRLGAPKP